MTYRYKKIESNDVMSAIEQDLIDEQLAEDTLIYPDESDEEDDDYDC